MSYSRNQINNKVRQLRVKRSNQAGSNGKVLMPPRASQNVVSTPQMNEMQPVIQRKVKFNQKNRQFFSDGKRPSWQAHTKRAIPGQKGQDRSHRISFKYIQGWVVRFCNKTMTAADFTKKTNSLYAGAGNTAEVKKMQTQRSLLVKNRKGSLNQWHSILSAAQALLSTLNSATPNLRMEDAGVNRGIGSRFHPNVSAGLMTPKSKGMYRANRGSPSVVARETPSGKHIYAGSGTVNKPSDYK